jgi:hypothetical protein
MEAGRDHGLGRHVRHGRQRGCVELDNFPNQAPPPPVTASGNGPHNSRSNLPHQLLPDKDRHDEESEYENGRSRAGRARGRQHRY